MHISYEKLNINSHHNTHLKICVISQLSSIEAHIFKKFKNIYSEWISNITHNLK